jgi:outer membrane lipoprotein-sorting protein
MKSKEEIEKLLESLGNAWPEDGSIVEGVMRTIESTAVRTSKFQGFKARVFSVRSNKRHSHILAIIYGLTAVIAVAVLWTFLGKQNQLAFAQVIENVQQTRSMVFKSKIEGAISVGEQQCIVLPDGKMRSEGINSYHIIDIQANKQMHVDKKRRTAQILPVLLSANGSMPKNGYAVIKNICKEAVERLPDDDIDGRKAIVYRVEVKGPEENGKTPMTVWVDPKSKLPLQMEQTIPFANGKQLKVLIYDMEFDQSFDPLVFSFVPPEGYELQTNDAIQPQIPTQSVAPSPSAL